MPDEIEILMDDGTITKLVKGPGAIPETGVPAPPLEKMDLVEPNIIPVDVALQKLIDALRMNG